MSLQESKVTSGYGTLRSENYINGYDNHNGHLFSDYIHRSDETVSSDRYLYFFDPKIEMLRKCPRDNDNSKCYIKCDRMAQFNL